ncbi:MAG TPA: lanthionine synthetase LanC family protein, partial [Thermoanaerobaculia bacterium]
AGSDSYDLVGGLVGLGVYALERLPRPGGRECLERVIALLAARAERTVEGVTWRTPQRYVPADLRGQYPEGYYNLGIAHGVPGVVALLAAAETVERWRRDLLDGAVAWLLARQLPDGASRYAYTAAPGDPPTPARLGWCYGDLGVAVALLAAARRAAIADWERAALALARFAASRSPESAETVDAGLCHGTAGLLHLFNRAYQATGDPLLCDAALAWFERTLELRRPGEGVGGFLSWEPDETGKKGWRSAPGLLTGAAGVGLALLAATTTVEPAWDRALLAEVPFPAETAEAATEEG